MDKEINFRLAKAGDSDLLLRWRNSINDGEVTREEHDKWVKSIIGNTDNILLIAEIDGKPVGSFRMDKFIIDGVGESHDMRLISYAVAPGLKKKGLDRAILAEGCICYGQEYGLIAKISDSNTISKRILESCDFQRYGYVEDGIVAYLRPHDKDDIIQ